MRDCGRLRIRRRVRASPVSRNERIDAVMKGAASASGSLKSWVRDRLPGKYQVPLKYAYEWLQGTLEREMAILEFLVRPRDRVLDVGGNRGTYAYRLWRLGARVEVFEPNPACASVLSAWAVGRPHVNVHSIALSSIAGSANLHIPIDASGHEHDASASIENAHFPRARDQRVVLQTLDSFGFDCVRLIKIDVEGHEFSVIEGAAATIMASRPALLIEIEQRHTARPISEVFAKIQGFGYRGYFMGPERMNGLDEFDAARHQSIGNLGAEKGWYINNFLFLHRERLAAGEYGALINSPFFK